MPLTGSIDLYDPGQNHPQLLRHQQAHKGCDLLDVLPVDRSDLEALVTKQATACLEHQKVQRILLAVLEVA